MSTDAPTKGLSKVEEIKIQSNYLRDGLAERLNDGSDHVDEVGYQLLKFSGMYQQDDRDQRKERRKAGLDRAYSFMVRSKLPAGIATAEQYLVHDDLAGCYGNGTLRFTTRQGIQLHGVLKGDIKPMLQDLNQALVTTLAACGDVNRNVMGCPAPEASREHALIERVCRDIEAHLLPRSEGYYDLWLDGERVKLEAPHKLTPDHLKADDVEPIYGKTYLPRKFKIGVAFPHDNCVDVFTQDIGIVPVLKGRTLEGFNLLVGGGMGMSHTDSDTHPRLGTPLGFVPPARLLDAVEVIITIQRNFGNRENRKRSRMKYLVEEWGIERFRDEFNVRFREDIAPWVEVGEFRVDDHLGWREQGDGLYYLGLPIENGRVKDEGSERLRSGLRTIVERFRPGVRITPQHNVLLTHLRAEDKDAIFALLLEYGIRTKDDISKARRYAMACPALPTCGLAVAESERYLPSLIDGIEVELERLGLGAEDISIRMTGCPNGCARPYTAELAFVGRSLGMYNVYVGGSFEGTQLVSPYAELVPDGKLLETIRPLFVQWKEARQPGERFGDFCRRRGIAGLQEEAERVLLPTA